nr:helix-turn-helix domain-containing protein [Nocardia sienata]
MSPVHRAEGEISAIGRTTEILKTFRDSPGVLSAAALVRRTGLAKTTVHRMPDDLVRVGLLGLDGKDYRLGLLLFEIGESVPRQRNLARRPGGTCRLCGKRRDTTSGSVCSTGSISCTSACSATTTARGSRNRSAAGGPRMRVARGRRSWPTPTGRRRRGPRR